ncbi:MAG: metal-dependent transcriptional regulator [Pseudomonadota bacterium]
MVFPRKTPRLSSQLEDYLEAICFLQKQDRVARAKDIAERLGVTRPSVTSALKSLAENGLISHEPYSYVVLTPAGEAVAEEITRRHGVLRDFFENFLSLPPDQADANACRVEHAVDSEAMDRLVAFLEFLRQCPRVGEEVVGLFKDYLISGCRGDCRDCASKAHED